MRSALALALLFLGACHPSEDGYLHENSPRVIDGDTLHVQGTRIRLAGINAPELRGHDSWCRPNCATGDGLASKWALEEMVGGADVSCRPEGTDRYGRTLATCWAECLQSTDGLRWCAGAGYPVRINLNQWLVQQGWAEPWEPRR